MPSVLFYYDIVCPYAYIASQRVTPLAAAAGVTVEWRPVLLGGIYTSIAAPQVPSSSWSSARADRISDDLRRQAALHGVPMNPPAAHPQRTVAAMRLLVGSPPDRRVALTHALYRAYWVEGLDLTDPSILSALARKHGVDPTVMTSASARAGLYANTAEAVSRGAFGVPTFCLGEQLWWGQDRLHLVMAAAGAVAATGQDALPAAAGPSPVEAVTFFHDFSSPFSYLASTQLAALAERYGVTVHWRPILLGALFRSIGTPNVPMLAVTEPKRRYYMRDLQDWARWWGVPFRFPSVFPVRTVLPLRVALLEPRATTPLYRALWAEDQDIGQPEVVRAVLSASGLDPGLVEQTQQPAVKAHLKENTAAAEAAGACGVPTLQLGEQLIWGQDRLPMLAEVLSGRLSLP